MAVCTLFDSNQTNASLIGIEYMITPEDYRKLPEREKPYWHYHVTNSLQIEPILTFPY